MNITAQDLIKLRDHHDELQSAYRRGLKVLYATLHELHIEVGKINLHTKLSAKTKQRYRTNIDAAVEQKTSELVSHVQGIIVRHARCAGDPDADNYDIPF